jgi:hypothetical protein
MKTLTDQQRLFLVDTIQLYEAWHSATLQVRSHRYGMKWLKSGNGEYLVRLSDAKGNGKSLGPRSAETEITYEKFIAGKAPRVRQFAAQAIDLHTPSLKMCPHRSVSGLCG